MEILKQFPTHPKQDVIKRFLEEHPPKSEALLREVLCCRINDAHDKKFRKLFFRLHDGQREIEDVVTAFLRTVPNSKQKFGTAPRGTLERKILDLFRELGIELGSF